MAAPSTEFGRRWARVRVLPWQAPTTILLSIVAGLLLAVGHHLFYANLHGREAHPHGLRILDSEVSPQQLNIAIGTAISFLVKAFLLLALSTAYLQLLWRALLRAAKGSTLGDLDTAFSGLNNLISLGKLWVWWRLPLLFILALAAWLLPLAAVVTPATLSIETAEMIPAPTTLQNVTSLSFESLNFVDDMPPVPHDDDPDALRFAYTLPRREVIEVVKAVAATGHVLPIAPPSPNASWAFDFTGPALQCTNISEPLSSTIRSNIAAATRNSGSACTAYGYISWLEGLPFINDSAQAAEAGEYAFNSRIFQGSSMPAVLYLAASPRPMSMPEHNAPPAACTDEAEELYDIDDGAVMLQCGLHAKTYHTTFNYTNGIQDVEVSTSLLDESSIQTVSSVNCTMSSEDDGSCDLNPILLRTLSYQAIMDAVTYLITGYVSAQQNETSPLISTQVISTALISTQELHFLTQPVLEQDSSSNARTLQQNIQSWESTKDDGLANTGSRESVRSLAETIELLFQNATVSMMSQTHLQPNASSAFAPQPVTVTHTTFHNIYTYSRAKLWIAYGAALIVTALASLLGLVAIAASGASYSSSNSFTAAFRLAHGAYLSADVRDADLDGRDPLPEHLAKAKMWPERSRAVQASRVDSMLLSRRSRTESIALQERPKYRSRTSSVSLLAPPEVESPAKSWSAL